MVRRTLDEQESTIVEEFYATMDGTLTQVSFDVDQDTQTFLLSFSDDSYSGFGSYIGQGLEWTEWSSQSNHVDGTYVLSEDAKIDQTIQTTKWGYSTSDTLDWSMVEELSPLSEAEWNTQFNTMQSQ